MKKLLLTAGALGLLAAGGCHKDPVDAVTVIHDCTGSYLRSGGKDYKVCNMEKTDAYENGTRVTARFRRIPDCRSLDGRFFCKMYHANEGWIEIAYIN